MADSTLSLTFTDMKGAVGEFLNYGYDSTNWSTNQAAQIERLVQAGYRQFLYPPATEGIAPGYEWSFLKPVTTITTVDEDQDQDLPDDFGRLIQGFVFAVDEQTPTIIADVGEAKIRELRQRFDESGCPRVAAVRIKAGTGSAGQRREVMWYPEPDDAYVLSYRYEAYTGKLTAALPYPLGGMEHGQVILMSCLAAAEAIREDTRGVHWDNFVRNLIPSILRDKRQGTKFYGEVGTVGEYDNSSGSAISGDYILSVAGVQRYP